MLKFYFKITKYLKSWHRENCTLYKYVWHYMVRNTAEFSKHINRL